MKKLLVSVLLLVLAWPVLAEEDATAAETRIRNSLGVLLPGLVPDSIRPTPVEGLYELVFGTRIIYITVDGRFLVQGKLVDLETRSEITEERLSALRVAAVEAVGEDNMVVFGPADARHTITVFTDIDCGYCRKLHAEMDDYNRLGIRVRYLFYPRAGVGSESYDKAVSVWCADDRNAAMDVAKAGREVPRKTCEAPVQEHYALGQEFRIQGTPALVLEDGEVLPGYVPADKLAKALDTKKGL
jgi:thiol:disulfide interchange protein DsbC